MRTILHSDMNCFYASVEMMLNPSLRGKAVAVCGSTESRHGIILAKSEKAKKAGVLTGMVNWEARQKCPDLILVPPHYEQYQKYSRLARNIYLRYTNLVEPYGMDECWLDITESESNYGSGEKIAEQIRSAIKDELGLSVSIGVSFNKIYAKLGSDLKKPDAITVISKENYRQLVWPLPASDLLYVGRATSAKLNRYGIHSIGDIAHADPIFLRQLLGVRGTELWTYASGHDTSRVMPDGYTAPIKSIGHGITCTADLETEEDVRLVILELSQDVGHRLRIHCLQAGGIQLAIRSSELRGQQFQCLLDTASQSPLHLAQAAFSLFQKQYSWSVPVRAVCVRAINLIPEQLPHQTSLFFNESQLDRHNRLDAVVEEIRRRYGPQAIRSSSLVNDLKMPDDGRHIVTMPGLIYK